MTLLSSVPSQSEQSHTSPQITGLSQIVWAPTQLKPGDPEDSEEEWVPRWNPAAIHTGRAALPQGRCPGQAQANINGTKQDASKCTKLSS